MKIALITLEGGGISTVCYGLAYQLSRKKIPVTIYTETSGKRELKSVSDSLKIAYLHRVELPPRSIWFQLQNFQFLLGNLSNFDIIHGVSPDASTLVTFYKRKLKKPYVVSFHAEPLTVARQFLKAPLSSWAPQDFAHQIVEYPLLSYNIRRCAKQADHIIVCSFAALKEFQNANRNLDLERVSVIYNAVDLDEIDGLDISDTYESKSENLSILFAGRLFWVKGLAYLLKAFEIVQEDLGSALGNIRRRPGRK